MTLPVTVPDWLHLAACDLHSEPWAGSWLSGAIVTHRGLLPRTMTAYEKLKFDGEFRRILKENDIALLKPPPFGSSQTPRLPSPTEELLREQHEIDRRCGVVGDISKLSPERRDMFERSMEISGILRRMRQQPQIDPD